MLHSRLREDLKFHRTKTNMGSSAKHTMSRVLGKRLYHSSRQIYNTRKGRIISFPVATSHHVTFVYDLLWIIHCSDFTERLSLRDFFLSEASEMLWGKLSRSFQHQKTFHIPQFCLTVVFHCLVPLLFSFLWDKSLSSVLIQDVHVFIKCLPNHLLSKQRPADVAEKRMKHERSSGPHTDSFFISILVFRRCINVLLVSIIRSILGHSSLQEL